MAANSAKSSQKTAQAKPKTKAKTKAKTQAKTRAKTAPKAGKTAKSAGSAKAAKSSAKPKAKKTQAKKPTARKPSTQGNKSDAGYSDRALFNKKPAKPRSRAAQQPLMRTLRAEHKHMASVMQIFSDQMDSIEAGELIDPHLVYEIMDYMVTWPDRFHHPREDLIYARVAELDPAGADEVNTLQRDHDNTGKLGRGLLQDVENWRQGDLTGSKLIKNGRAYVDHIHEHMNIEEKLVFPHIESTLSAQDWRDLDAEDQLAAVSTPIFGAAVQREFRNVARKLRRGVRRSVEQQTMNEWIGIEAFMESLEVISMAYDSTRHSASEHGRDALKEATDIIRENPISAPLKVAANNARMTLGFIGEVAEISRETFDDLVNVNQARKDRARILARKAP
jgi:hemerythrin-like domain-containing protein